MQVTVIGGTGRIGSRVVNRLRDHGHRVLAASASTGVDTITGEGLGDALAGADVVVDVINSPSTAEAPATWFFSTSTAHLLAAERAAGVTHHVGLSVLGAGRVSSGYFRAKLAQEARVQESGIPYTILRTTMFFEYVDAVADDATDGPVVRLAHVPMQPVAADDVAAALAHLAFGSPLNGTLEMAGPEQCWLDELARRVLGARRDGRTVVADAHAPYLGAVLDYGERSLLPDLRVGATRFEDWLDRQVPERHKIDGHPVNQTMGRGSSRR
jgi:uncharacterized protein YbjT (DUF2867 family)